MSKELYMKDFNGEKVFSLEYDKETLRDMLLDKQEEIERLNKDLDTAIGICNNRQKEIVRLSNIINKLEKESYLGMKENRNNNDYSKGLYTAYQYINNKIQELKGDE